MICFNFVCSWTDAVILKQYLYWANFEIYEHPSCKQFICSPALIIFFFQFRYWFDFMGLINKLTHLIKIQINMQTRILNFI